MISDSEDILDFSEAIKLAFARYVYQFWGTESLKEFWFVTALMLYNFKFLGNIIILCGHLSERYILHSAQESLIVWLIVILA